MRNKKVRYIIKVAIFSSLSFLFYNFLKIPVNIILPFMPGFLDIQFSNVPAIIAGYLLGPVGGSFVVIVRSLLKLPFSSTQGIGELTDMLIGLSVVLVTSIIYKKNHSKKGAVISLLFGLFAWVISGSLVSSFIACPLYMNVFHFPYNAFLGTINLSFINESNFLLYYALFICIPFNLLLGVIVLTITYFIYKRISIFFTFIEGKIDKEDNKSTSEKN